MPSFFATNPKKRDFWSSSYKARLDASPSNSEVQKTMELYEMCDNWESSPSDREGGLEEDLRRSREISDKCKASEPYSQNLYAALCNNTFSKGGKRSSFSWRQAASVVAHMRESGDYLDWYCSGSVASSDFVPESSVTEEVRADMQSLGWGVVY